MAGSPRSDAAACAADLEFGLIASREPMTVEQRRARMFALLSRLEEALAETDRLDLLAVGARLSSAVDLLRIQASRETGGGEPPWPRNSRRG